VGLNDGDSGAKLCRSYRGDIPTRSRAENDDVRLN
jgi:hypothetical protein